MLVHDLPATTLHNAYDRGLSASELINRHSARMRSPLSYRLEDFNLGSTMTPPLPNGDIQRRLIPCVARHCPSEVMAHLPLA